MNRILLRALRSPRLAYTLKGGKVEWLPVKLVYNLAVHVTLIYIPAHGAGGGLTHMNVPARSAGGTLCIEVSVEAHPRRHPG